MRTIVHLSDVHFGRLDPGLVEPGIDGLGLLRVTHALGERERRSRQEQGSEGEEGPAELVAPEARHIAATGAHAGGGDDEVGRVTPEPAAERPRSIAP